MQYDAKKITEKFEKGKFSPKDLIQFAYHELSENAEACVITEKRPVAAIKYYAEELCDNTVLILYSPKSRTMFSEIIGVPFSSLDRVALKGWKSAMRNAKDVSASGGGLYLVKRTEKRKKRGTIIKDEIEPLLLVKPF